MIQKDFNKITKDDLEDLYLQYGGNSKASKEIIKLFKGLKIKQLEDKFYSFYNTLEDFQKFIDKFKIESVNDLKSKFYPLKTKLYKLPDKNKIVMSKKHWSGDLFTLEHFQNYVDRGGYISIKDWCKKSKGKYVRKYFDKSINLGLIDKIKFKFDYKLLSDSLKDIQEFINQKYVRNLQELYSRFPKVYDLVIDKDLRALITFPINNRPDFSWIKSLDEFKNAIHKLNITNRFELRKEYFGLFCIGFKNIWLAAAGLPGPNNEGYKFIKTFEDLQDYIYTRREITSLDILMNNPEFKKLKSHIIENNFDVSSLKFNTIKKIPNNFKITDLESAQWFVDYMGYMNPSQFKQDFFSGGQALYRNVERLKVADKLIYQKRKTDWSHIKTEIDIKKFVEENDIKNYRDMYNRFSGLYNYLSDNNLTKYLSKYYTGYSKFDSSWEEDIFRYIERNHKEFINLLHNIDLGCKDINPLPFDIVFEYNNRKFIIEVLGVIHFKKVYSGKEDKYIKTRKHDIMKKRWAEDNEYTILYYTKEYKGSNYYLEYGYPYYVYHNLETLIKDIKSE